MQDDSSRSSAPDAAQTALRDDAARPQSVGARGNGMPGEGWSRLLDEVSPADTPEVLHAYSEAMPPPRLGVKPTGVLETAHRMPGDEHGWRIDEYEEHL